MLSLQKLLNYDGWLCDLSMMCKEFAQQAPPEEVANLLREATEKFDVASMQWMFLEPLISRTPGQTSRWCQRARASLRYELRRLELIVRALQPESERAPLPLEPVPSLEDLDDALCENVLYFNYKKLRQVSFCVLGNPIPIPRAAGLTACCQYVDMVSYEEMVEDARQAFAFVRENDPHYFIKVENDLMCELGKRVRKNAFHL